MVSKPGRPRKASFPRFDSALSFRTGLALLKATGTPHALAGRVAVWQYVPPQGQLFTKDVDFAVPYGHAEAVARTARERGYRVTALEIGGFGVQAPGVALDFIDRRRGLGALFAEAVARARRSRKRLRVGRASVPVVPRDHLVAMKLATAEPKDERDVEELLRGVTPGQYAPLRALVVRHLGFYAGERLDRIALTQGHRGPASRSRRYARRS
jgi:hypothetical protein